MSRYFKFPEMWRQVLIEQRAAAADWLVAVDLLNRAKHSRVMKFSNERAAALGISPSTKRRSLNRLAAWSLIWFRNRKGASPMVTVKWLDKRQPSGR
jgi:hypothetical protein